MFALVVFNLPNYCPGKSTFSPKDKAELKIAVTTCLETSRDANCSDSVYGPIGDWDPPFGVPIPQNGDTARANEVASPGFG